MAETLNLCKESNNALRVLGKDHKKTDHGIVFGGKDLEEDFNKVKSVSMREKNPGFLKRQKMSFPLPCFLHS